MSTTLPFKNLSSKRLESLAKSTEQYAIHVGKALSYLEKRGIDEDAALDWQLGYVNEPMPGHEQFQGMLAIPYLTTTNVVWMKFRCIEDHSDCEQYGHAKYNAEGGYSTRMFGVRQLRSDTRVVAVCEGELDAVVATECAGIPSVSVPGANAWKLHYQYLFEPFDEVIVLADGDEPGKKLGDKIVDSIYNARVTQMPQGEDVTSFVVAHGGDALRKRAGLT